MVILTDKGRDQSPGGSRKKADLSKAALLCVLRPAWLLRFLQIPWLRASPFRITLRQVRSVLRIVPNLRVMAVIPV